MNLFFTINASYLAFERISTRTLKHKHPSIYSCTFIKNHVILRILLFILKKFFYISNQF